MDNIFNLILDLSLSSSVVILAVLGLRFMLKKQSKSFSYYLWTLVFIKLVVPISFEIENSFVPREVQDIIVVSVQVQENDMNEALEPIISTAQDSDLVREHIVQNNNPVNQSANLNEIKISQEIEIKSIIWAFGAGILLLYFIFSLVNIKNSVRFAYKYRRNIYLCENVKIPFILGLFKPIIYLPEEIEQRDKEYIIKHENVHIKRLDYLIKPICFIIAVMHWFNPLVWISFILMTKDMEMSCDERVIKELGQENKKDYSRALLNFAIKESSYSMVAVLFAEKEPEKRIMNILKFKKPQKIIVSIFAVIVSVLVFVLFTSEKQQNLEVVALLSEETVDIYNMDNVEWLDRSFVIATIYNLEENNNSYDNFGLLDFDYNITPVFDSVEDKSDERYLLKNLGVSEPRGMSFEDYTTGTYSKDNEYLSLANLPLNKGGSVVEFYSFENLELASKYEYDFSEIISGNTVDELIVYEKINESVEFLVLKASDENIYILKAENKIWQVQSTFIDEHPPYATVRFVNESIGLYGYWNQNDNWPNARITYDGGKTWEELDFSSFDLNPDISYEVYNVFIDGGRIDVHTEIAKGLHFSSTDFGKTWVIESYPIIDENQEIISEVSDSGYIWPTTDFRWSRGYTGEYPEHSGIDLAAPLGTDVYAAKAGVVIDAKFAESGYGWSVLIEHDDGNSTFYAQCNELLVEIGDEVEQGDTIAKVGATGWATGNHLHFEIRLEDGTTTDPLAFLP